MSRPVSRPIKMRLCTDETRLRGLRRGAGRSGGLGGGTLSPRRGCLAGIVSLLILLSLPAPSPAADATPSYAGQIRPLFQRRCMPCHDDATRTSRLSLESYAALMRGGTGGAVVVP